MTPEEIARAREYSDPELDALRAALPSAHTATILWRLIAPDQEFMDMLKGKSREFIAAVTVALSDEIDARIPPRSRS